MGFNTKEEALKHFHSRFSTEKFNCIIKKISSGYSYVATPIDHFKTVKINLTEKESSNIEASTGFLESPTDTHHNAKESAPKLSTFITNSLRKIKKTTNKHQDIHDEPLSDEAIRAVIASKAKRRKPVPYVREEFNPSSIVNINKSDSDRPRCIYCGDYRSGIVRDHVVSVAWRGGVRHYDRGHTVPSCPQCNNLLGDKPLHNIIDRAAFLIDAIEHHERRYLFTVDRTEEELAEMDHFLAISIKSAMYEKAVALQRLEYVKQVASGYYDYATIKHLVKQGREIS